MNKKYKDLSTNTLIFMISNFGSKLISFFLVPLYTYVLSTTEYGLVDLVTTTVQLLVPVLTLNVQDAVLRFSLDDEYKKENVLKVATRIIALSSMALLIMLGTVWALNIVQLNSSYLTFLFASYFVGSLYNTLTMYLRASDKMKLIAVSGVINTAVTCLLNIVLLLAVKIGVTGYMIANVSGMLIADIIMITNGGVLKNLREANFDRKIAKPMILYGLPLVVNSIAWWINNASDRYILSYFCGAAINGIYAVSYKIPTILAMIQNTFYNAWSVSAITEFDEDDKDGFIGNVYSMYSAVCVISSSLIMLLNIFIAKLLYAKEFFQAWKYVPFLLVGTVFSGLGLFIGCIFTAVKQTKDISSTTFTGAIVNTILNFMLIPWIGALGAAIATMIGYLTTFTMRLIKVRKIIRMQVGWKNQILSFIVLLAQCIVATYTSKQVFQVIFLVLQIIINKIVIADILIFIKNRLKRT